MQRSDMVERHRPCRTNALFGACGVHGISIQVDRAAKVPGIRVVVIVDLSLVRPCLIKQSIHPVFCVLEAIVTLQTHEIHGPVTAESYQNDAVVNQSEVDN